MQPPNHAAEADAARRSSNEVLLEGPLGRINGRARILRRSLAASRNASEHGVTTRV